ncbi:unnamed protein product [Sphenostylis stenocarpa]|uniref:Uncharacterized protein n=1 Tax=Sphenostylis stenocarpa TaxID=92480 RepID=A0AA86VW28_9FABA|nr:unnamed protein product [Sphenostylis stenocarpa]
MNNNYSPTGLLHSQAHDFTFCVFSSVEGNETPQVRDSDKARTFVVSEEPFWCGRERCSFNSWSKRICKQKPSSWGGKDEGGPISGKKMMEGLMNQTFPVEEDKPLLQTEEETIETIMMNNEVVPSTARKLTSATTSADEKQVVTSTGNREHHHKAEADPRSSYYVEKKEEKYDKNQLFPPMFPYPYPYSFPFPRPLFPRPFPLPSPYVPGFPWPGDVPSFPFPPVGITDAYFPAHSPPT